MLPPVSFTKAGFDHVPSGVFTDSRPCPRRPPSTSPILSVSGMTTIALASSNITAGIPDSGIAWISCSTRRELRARSSSWTPALAGRARARASTAVARRGRTGMWTPTMGCGNRANIEARSRLDRSAPRTFSQRSGRRTGRAGDTGILAGMTASPVPPPGAAPATAVVLANLGTPDAPTPEAVRRYLGEFLGDRRVVDLPRLVWLPLLHGVILPLRAPKVAPKYAEVWMEG